MVYHGTRTKFSGKSSTRVRSTAVDVSTDTTLTNFDLYVSAPNKEMKLT
jgi:hypothetical protein